MDIFINNRPKRGDLTIEKSIAKQIARGIEGGIVVEDDGTIHFWELNVNTKD